MFPLYFIVGNPSITPYTSIVFLLEKNSRNYYEIDATGIPAFLIILDTRYI